MVPSDSRFLGKKCRMATTTLLRQGSSGHATLLSLVYMFNSGFSAQLRCKQWMADSNFCARVTHFTDRDVAQIVGHQPEGIRTNLSFEVYRIESKLIGFWSRKI